MANIKKLKKEIDRTRRSVYNCQLALVAILDHLDAADRAYKARK